MNKIDWCKQQKKGIELVEPNSSLSEAYFLDANDSIDLVREAKGKWKPIVAYYSCYYALYALLMKVGIKCEIHECTIELMRLFGFKKDEIEFMKKLKKERIEVQYYRKEPSKFEIKKVNEFVIVCKNISLSLNEDEIKRIRGLVKND